MMLFRWLGSDKPCFGESAMQAGRCHTRDLSATRIAGNPYVRELSFQVSRSGALACFIKRWHKRPFGGVGNMICESNEVRSAQALPDLSSIHQLRLCALQITSLERPHHDVEPGVQTQGPRVPSIARPCLVIVRALSMEQISIHLTARDRARKDAQDIDAMIIRCKRLLESWSHKALNTDDFPPRAPD